MKKSRNWLNHLFNFLAVILGVLLAFYISERANANHERAESRLFLTSLSDDLAEHIHVYETYQIPDNVQHMENVNVLLQLLITDSVEVIGEQLPTILEVNNYAPNSSTYTSLKSSGKLALIENFTLRKMLTSFYEGVVPESEYKGQYQVDYFTDELLSWLTENADLASMEVLRTDQLTVLRNKLIVYLSLISQKVESYEMIVRDSREIRQMIDSLYTGH